MADLPQWPSQVPYEPLRDNFEMLERYRPNLTHQTEQGPGRQRAVGGAIWTKMKYRILVTQDQADVIDSFFLNTLRQGASRFKMKVGRFYRDPATWPLKVCMIENGTFTIGVMGVDLYVEFNLMALDW